MARYSFSQTVSTIIEAEDEEDAWDRFEAGEGIKRSSVAQITKL